MWQWTSLVKGENLSGRLLAQPPCFWYGRYSAPFENPFAVSNQTSCLQSEEGSDLNSETKAVVNVIRETCVPTPDMATDPSTSTKDAVVVMDYKENGGQNASREEKVSSPSKLNVPKLSTNSEEPPEKQEEPQKVQEQPCVIEKAKEGELSLDQLHPIEMREAIHEVGSLKKIWRKWFRGDDDYQEKIFHTVNEKVNPDVKCVQSTGQSSDMGKLPPSSISTNEVITDAEMKCAESVDKFGKPRGGIFNQIVRWCKFWKSDENSDNLNAEHSKSVEEVSSRLEMQEVFTESFCNDMLAFLGTPEGSVAMLQSKTRQEIVQNLLRSGPPQLQSLNKTHISHLMDLLISEKKWITEHPSQTFPFKLTVPTKPTSSTKPFNSKQPTKDNNPTIPVKKNISPKTRTQILSECQKLVNEVVKEYPDGFQIGAFKKLFLNRHGYNLEVQQLGYQKFETLLQIIPGVKIESNYILPSGDHKRGFEDNNSQWEESGPICRMNTKKDDHGFEMLSDNDLSDSETERLVNGSKRGREKDSSLQILDSWYSNRDECSDMNVDHSNDNGNFEMKKKPSVTRLLQKKKKPSVPRLLQKKKKPSVPRLLQKNKN